LDHVESGHIPFSKPRACRIRLNAELGKDCSQHKTKGNVMSIIFDAYLIFIIPALIALVGVAIWEQLL